MNILTEAEPDLDEMVPKMLKRMGRHKPTVPYHKPKQCENKFHCPWHHRRSK